MESGRKQRDGLLLEVGDEFLDFLQRGRDLIGVDPHVVELEDRAGLFAVDLAFADGVPAVFELVPEARIGLEVVFQAVGADAGQPEVELLEELFMRSMYLGEREVQADGHELLAFQDVAQLGAFGIGVFAHADQRAALRPKGDTEQPPTPPRPAPRASRSSKRSGS